MALAFGPALIRVDPIRSELAREAQVEHALNRLAYGPRPGDAARVADVGLERWIAMQLSPERLDDSAADSAMQWVSDARRTHQGAGRDVPRGTDGAPRQPERSGHAR